MGLAQAIQLQLQALLGKALGMHLAAQADDAGGLARAAGGDVGQLLLGQGAAALLGLEALVATPDQQGEGTEQGEAIEGLAQGGHAAALLQAQLAWRW